MVFVRKTYARTRTVASRVGAAIMLVIGFITLIIMPSVKMPGHLFGNSGEIGIAHADAPSYTAEYLSCSACDDDNCDCDGCASDCTDADCSDCSDSE